jgi:hypothetical protein
MYSSATEALKGLMAGTAAELEEKGLECQITKLISPSSGQLSNGIDYCFVEVTCENGVQYGIPAYGKEAEELYRLAMRYLSKTEREKELFLGCLVSARS